MDSYMEHKSIGCLKKSGNKRERKNCKAKCRINPQDIHAMKYYAAKRTQQMTTGFTAAWMTFTKIIKWEETKHRRLHA